MSESGENIVNKKARIKFKGKVFTLSLNFIFVLRALKPSAVLRARRRSSRGGWVLNTQ